MAMERIYITDQPMVYQAGHQGENLARCICFPIDGLKEQYGEGTWTIVFRRPFESDPYVVSNQEEVGDYAVWGLDATDTAVCGTGRAELRYYVDEVLCKTNVYAISILPALGETGEAPSPYEDILDTVAGYANSAAESAAEAAGYAEDLGDKVAGAAADWLAEHVDPATGYVIDDSLTIQGAAADAKKTGDEITELKNQISKVTIMPITLLASGWTNNAQTVAVTGVLADSTAQLIEPIPQEGYESLYNQYGITATAQAADSLTFECGITPSIDIPVNVKISGVKYGS